MAYKHIEWLKLLLFLLFTFLTLFESKLSNWELHGTLFRCQQIFRNLKQRFSPGLQTNTIHILLIMV